MQFRVSGPQERRHMLETPETLGGPGPETPEPETPGPESPAPEEGGGEDS
jgi:hypothetical protein